MITIQSMEKMKEVLFAIRNGYGQMTCIFDMRTGGPYEGKKQWQYLPEKFNGFFYLFQTFKNSSGIAAYKYFVDDGIFISDLRPTFISIFANIDCVFTLKKASIGGSYSCNFPEYLPIRKHLDITDISKFRTKPEDFILNQTRAISSYSDPESFCKVGEIEYFHDCKDIQQIKPKGVVVKKEVVYCHQFKSYLISVLTKDKLVHGLVREKINEEFETDFQDEINLLIREIDLGNKRKYIDYFNF